jgi:uncharacterized tellurite resistance protein B-like protein
MFQTLLRKLIDPAPQPLPDPEARLALAALMVRVARTDRVYDDDERRQIDRVLTARYRLSPFEVAALRSQAEQLEQEAPDTVRFTRAIKEAVPYEDRTAVIEAMWIVAIADGTRDNDEANLLRLVANLLGVNDTDSNTARRRVEARLK